ncbi:hypothetical protein B0H17DRAFT_1149405 [Mycena rosella]|uniref:Uncharacterized protein n=1 Tax=Mycena rosella TaxID=1033263 RepID=A0AAD7FQH1_MYCRO|nr:hypothetical protein B0H17DRAFT_1149405 [Mycena rosella]
MVGDLAENSYYSASTMGRFINDARSRKRINVDAGSSANSSGKDVRPETSISGKMSSARWTAGLESNNDNARNGGVNTEIKLAILHWEQRLHRARDLPRPPRPLDRIPLHLRLFGSRSEGWFSKIWVFAGDLLWYPRRRSCSKSWFYLGGGKRPLSADGCTAQTRVQGPGIFARNTPSSASAAFTHTPLRSTCQKHNFSVPRLAHSHRFGIARLREIGMRWSDDLSDSGRTAGPMWGKILAHLATYTHPRYNAQPPSHKIPSKYHGHTPEIDYEIVFRPALVALEDTIRRVAPELGGTWCISPVFSGGAMGMPRQTDDEVAKRFELRERNDIST